MSGIRKTIGLRGYNKENPSKSRVLHEGQMGGKQRKYLYKSLMLNGGNWHCDLYIGKLSICNVLAAFSFAASTI